MKDNQDTFDYDFILFVQINDVYHIDTSADYSDDNSLILPRISTILKRLRSKYTNRVRFCLPGDFLGPSCLSKEFKGAQMVSVLNAMGLDYVTFGNHEFEDQFTQADVIERINESEFTWLSSNFMFIDESNEDRGAIHQKLVDDGDIEISPYLRLSDNNGIVLLGLMYQGVYKGFGKAFDPVQLCKEMVTSHLKGLDRAKEKLNDENVGLTIVALTHQDLSEDIRLAKECRELRLIMGGHDHDVIEHNSDTSVLITKTASNARTLRLNWIVAIPRHQIDSLVADGFTMDNALTETSTNMLEALLRHAFNVMLTGSGEPRPEDVKDFALELHRYSAEDKYGLVDDVRVGHQLSGGDYVFVFSVAIDTRNPNFVKIVPEDQEVRNLITEWLGRSKETSDVIITAPRELVLEDRFVRSGSTNFGNFAADVVRGMPPFGDLSVREAEVGLINSGGFRLDRNIQKNEGISKKTLCDIFFHPNSVLLFQLKGAELLEVLRKSLSLIKNSREGDGNFLQIGGIKMNAKDLEIKKVGLVSLHGSYEPLNMERDYTVATTYYVARKCGEYKQWFDGKEGMIRADDIKSAVEMALRQLQDFGEIEVSLISGEKPEQLNYFEAYLALNNEPRWLLT